MGIKDNFAQAVKELTGSAKEYPERPERSERNKSIQVEDLRRAVEEEPIGARLSSPTPAPETATPKPVIEQISVTPPAEAIPAATVSPAAVNPASTVASTQSLEQDFLNMNMNMNMGGAPFGEPAYGSAIPAGYQEPTPPLQPMSSLTGMNAQNRGAAYTSAFGDYTSGISAQSQPHQNQNVAMLNPYPIADDMAGLSEELTVISKNTVIEGNIRSFANMNIDGNIRGDIETTKNIDLNGKIIGNLTCNNAQMLTSQIQGNIRMKGNVLMGRDTLLIGDLVSTYAKVNGKIKGNLEIGGKAELKGDAVIFGDISASTITVDDGAIIQGYVSTTFLNKEESRNIFPESISIAD